MLDYQYKNTKNMFSKKHRKYINVLGLKRGNKENKIGFYLLFRLNLNKQ